MDVILLRDTKAAISAKDILDSVYATTQKNTAWSTEQGHSVAEVAVVDMGMERQVRREEPTWVSRTYLLEFLLVGMAALVAVGAVVFVVLRRYRRRAVQAEMWK